MTGPIVTVKNPHRTATSSFRSVILTPIERPRGRSWLFLKLSNIRVNNQQHPSFQRDSGALTCKYITHAAWLAEIQRFTMQGIIEVSSSHACGLARQWQEREQIPGVPVNNGMPRPTQEPAAGWTIDNVHGDRFITGQQQDIRHR